MTNDPYLDFLRAKSCMPVDSGFDVPDSDINPLLKPHQRAIVRWAVRGGRRAVFAAFGLGKTIIQLEILRLILKHAGEAARGLIVAPLGVRQEFKRDAEMLGITIRFVRTSEEVTEPGLYITNYESVRDGKLDPNLFDAVSLDEASCLRSYGSKTFQTFLTLFEGVLYRFVATATPAPNKFKELIHYAGFLGIMDTGQALTRFFQRNPNQANDLTLYPHMEREFWLWLNSWAVFLQKPSDLGFDDTGYDLPELKVHWHEIRAAENAKVFIETRGQARLFRDTSTSLPQAAAEKRDSMADRIIEMQSILQASENVGDNFIIWHDLEDERHAIKRALPAAHSVYGTQDLEIRENEIIDFSDGKYQYLSTKPSVAGSGCNFQRYCHKAIFLGVGYKFNDFIQAIFRIQRFLQKHACEIHIIYTEAERAVVQALKKKWAQDTEMRERMSEIIKEHGLSNLSLADALQRSIGVERIEVRGEKFTVAHNDCVAETRRMETDSVDEIITSIPFSNHYEYTAAHEDFGYTENNDHFWTQMDFLSSELLRVLKPGRLACIHVKDRILFGNTTGTGVPTVSPFHAEAIFHYKKHQFDYMGMITVVTDVVRENNQTYRLGWSENAKDGTKMGVGCPEYVLLFRKPQSDRTKGYADVPVAKAKKYWDKSAGPVIGEERNEIDGADEMVPVYNGDYVNPDGYSRARWQVDAHALWRSSGDRTLTSDELANYGPDMLAKVFTEWSLKGVYDYEAHIKIGEELEKRGCLPSSFMSLAPGSHDPDVWHDVHRMHTLNGKQSQKGLVNHVCPLQIDIVDRLIDRYSNEGEVIFDPFGGLFTVPYRAIIKGRYGRGCELNGGYFLDGIKYLQAAEIEVTSPSLFDFLDADALEAVS